MEDRFNKKFGYDYVLLNEQPFDDQFKQYVPPFPIYESALPSLTYYSFSRLEELTDSKITYGLIPNEDWVQPDWIDEEKASAAREEMVKNNVIYGGAFMCMPRCGALITRLFKGSVPYVGPCFFFFC
jgi:alpha 1,2-mannosyltransferase